MCCCCCTVYRMTFTLLLWKIIMCRFSAAEYGRGCNDIGCPPSEICMIAQDSCSYNQQDGKDCGTYPTCRKSNAVSNSPGKQHFWGHRCKWLLGFETIRIVAWFSVYGNAKCTSYMQVGIYSLVDPIGKISFEHILQIAGSKKLLLNFHA